MTLEEIENKINKTVGLLGLYPHSNAISEELDRLFELKTRNLRIWECWRTHNENGRRNKRTNI